MDIELKEDLPLFLLCGNKVADKYHYYRQWVEPR